MSDGDGPAVTQGYSVNVTGANDRPTVVEELTDRSATFQEAGPNETVPASRFIRVAGADVDGGVVTFSVPAETPFAVLTPTQGGLGFTYTPKDINYFGTEVVTVRLNDPQGGGQFTEYQVTVTITANLDENVGIDNGLNPLQIDADGSGFTAGDRFAFIDNSALPTNVEIANFRLGDTIRVSAPAANYSFAVTENGDLEVTYTDAATGAPNRILLKGVAVAAGFIDDEASAEAQLGLGNFFISDAVDTSANNSLDVDDDGDLSTLAEFDAAAGNIAFTDDANVSSRAVIRGFSVGDTINVTNAQATDYSFARDAGAGNDVVITYNTGTSINEIVLLGAAEGSSGVIDSLDDLEALFGDNFFTASGGIGGGGTGGNSFEPSGDPVSIDNASGTLNFDASQGSILFTDNASTRTDVIIAGFGSNDRISSTTDIGNYSFTVSDEDPDDLVITFNNNGVINQIVLDEVLAGKEDVFIDSYESARDAVGSEIFLFG